MARIGDLLIEAGVLTQEQLSYALRHQHQHGGKLGTNLVELGFVDERTIANVLARQMSIPSVTATQVDKVAPQTLRLLSAEVVERLRVVPIRDDAGKLWVAMADPTDKGAIDEMAGITGRVVRPMVAPDLLIQYALEKYYQVRRRSRTLPPLPTLEGLRLDTGPVALIAPETPTQPDLQPISLENETLDEPTALRAPAVRLSLQDVTAHLLQAQSDNAVIDFALRYLMPDVPRVAVFLCRGDELAILGNRGVDGESLKRIRLGSSELPLATQALVSGEVFLGPLAPMLLGRLSMSFGMMGEEQGIVVPLRVEHIPFGFILGVGVAPALVRRKPEVQRLAQKLSLALQVNSLRRLLQQP